MKDQKTHQIWGWNMAIIIMDTTMPMVWRICF